jgi:hypothetical protein
MDIVKYFAILDERKVWAADAIRTAQKRGYKTRHIPPGQVMPQRVEDVVPGGLYFLRPHAHPVILKRNQLIDYAQMGVQTDTIVQDRAQVEVYENKSEQFARWGSHMPPTWRFTDKEAAENFILDWRGGPLVSKADVGASSYNVRILNNMKELLRHVDQIFGDGIQVDHCAGGAGVGPVRSIQKGYVLLQEFIPHEITWRVNRVGRALACFMRKNYKDRAVAQTGNVAPVMAIDDRVGSLFHYARGLLDQVLDSRWIALDILWDDTRKRWFLLETSLAWPWPSPGKCMEAPFFGTTRKWGEIWDVMFDEYEKGVWTRT